MLQSMWRHHGYRFIIPHSPINDSKLCISIRRIEMLELQDEWDVDVDPKDDRLALDMTEKT